MFAWALDWPGWCRGGKTEEQAIEALALYGARYAVVARQAGIPAPSSRLDSFHVVERLTGTAGYTDFGVPGAVAKQDWAPLTSEETHCQIALLAASWVVCDRIAAATPAALRKGPRGGGRDRDQVIDHLLGAETAYARKLGVKHRQPGREDAQAIAALRAAIISAIQAAATSTPPASTGWPPRYALRRIAWHVLDHAWEMEDRGSTQSGTPPVQRSLSS